MSKYRYVQKNLTVMLKFYERKPNSTYVVHFLKDMFMEDIFNEINKWFHSNILMLNYDKTYFLQFLTKMNNEFNMQVSFGNRKIGTAQSLKFLGLTTDTTLTWKHHTGELTSRLNKACYAIRLIKPFMSLDVMRSTYFFFFFSIISYGIIFWGNSSYSEDIFNPLNAKLNPICDLLALLGGATIVVVSRLRVKIQKRIIRIIMNSSRNAS
jgi:hypothetical protein